jgi:ribosomal protein S18 acetylase RimI-like enzyme
MQASRTEKLNMAVLLKNLVARAPKMEDVVAINKLIAGCEIATYARADNSLEDLDSNWQQPGFILATDARVIVTNKGQCVGFAEVWHRNYEQIFTFVCVHPEYRSRGIGTLVLRLMEERARMNVRHANPGTRVTLCGMVSSANEQAKRLFEHEGYKLIRRFWRIAVGSNDSLEKSARLSDFKADLDIDSLNLVNATQLFDLDAIYIIREYDIYEKELRAAELLQVSTEDELKVLVAVG